MSNHV